MKEEGLFGSKEEMLSLIEKQDYFHHDLFIDPFDRLVKRNPPYWFRHLYIKVLFEIYDNWKFYAEQLGVPYYLKIWLFDKEFPSTQIVFGVNQRIQRYENLFMAHDLNKDIPAIYASNNNFQEFIWSYAKEVMLLDEEDLECFPQKDLRRLKEQGYLWQETTQNTDGEDQAYYCHHCDNIWIGEK